MKEKMQIVNTIKNENSLMKVYDNGFLHIVYFKDVLIEVSDVKEVQSNYNFFENPKPTKVIVELETGVSISLAARKYAAQHSPKLDGVAYIIDGLAQRLLVRFYIGMWKIKKPSKIYNVSNYFDSFNESVKWLVELK